MKSLPPSPFTSSAVVESAEALPVSAPGKGHCPAGSAAPIEDDISNIGEIFAGARKLEDREIPLSELCDRGFDAHAFMDALDELPLFLRTA